MAPQTRRQAAAAAAATATGQLHPAPAPAPKATNANKMPAPTTPTKSTSKTFEPAPTTANPAATSATTTSKSTTRDSWWTRPAHPLAALPRDVADRVLAMAPVLHRAKRIVVVAGAGISVSAGIPDFRSPDGMYALAKHRPGGARLSRGQDWFDAGVFRTEATTRLFYSLMGSMRAAALAASPTPTHEWLAALESRGSLLRCYSQNIDDLEPRAGLAADSLVQVHGTLSRVRCVVCHRTAPHSDEVATEFQQGNAPPCVACETEAEAREKAGKRARAIGVVRPDVVLYNETHPAGDEIAERVAADANRRPDVLIVMGTSLAVPGIKHLVRDMAAAVREDAPRKGKRARRETSEESDVFVDVTNIDTTAGTGRRRKVAGRGGSAPTHVVDDDDDFELATRNGHVILVNRTTLAAKEWEGVFDTVITADADTVVEGWNHEFARLDALAAQRRAKRAAAAARKAERDRGQSKLMFPVVKNRPTVAALAAIKAGQAPLSPPPSSPTSPRVFIDVMSSSPLLGEAPSRPVSPLFIDLTLSSSPSPSQN
ncbi:hypothetical protein AMAG_18009 [Allomyces macrogynus ATCC 38327]|uniref:Deacetylase sirtuin-type domain-containing protein n=1 Tax=Allomyces macrogynus (strain ATCC 38327) TaxID=578462 RepID=A0A0L0S418_ALLM3|nr:hypothetical protein AMAG_18009 [Allomyces macrogynus ATCC 38327]|eukprot:KNE57160.1 hypothetical protein AMAG_18009 [Allomyces macrogynus ATCC 38327]